MPPSASENLWERRGSDESGTLAVFKYETVEQCPYADLLQATKSLILSPTVKLSGPAPRSSWTQYPVIDIAF